MLSVVLPSYNEEGMIQTTAEKLAQALEHEAIEYELIFVNDGSADQTQARIEEVRGRNARVHYIMFSRNFGKEAAIFAGLAAAKGECVALMDCDLQHPIGTLIEMYRKWEEGYEVVAAVKRSRGQESGFHRFAAGLFYGLMTRAVRIDMSRASDFKLLDRRAVDTLLAMPEYHVFFRALSAWIGYKTIAVEFDVQEREVGESKWSFFSLTRYALNNIVEYSAAPLYLVMWAGAIVFIFALCLGVQTLYRYITGSTQPGFTTVILLQLLTSALLMLGLGIVGMYLSKIYDEVKRRPRYIISKME